jgi:CRP-like cAMP-binding protein
MVIKEGEQGREFYIIEQGELDCLKLHEYKGKRGFVFVRTLSSGQHFGELALLNNMNRSLSIRAKTSCRLLKLDRDSFTRILGSIEEHLAKDYGNEFQKRLDIMQGERRVNSEQVGKNFFIDIDLDKGPISHRVESDND